MNLETGKKYRPIAWQVSGENFSVDETNGKPNKHSVACAYDDLPGDYRAVARLGWTSDTGDRDGTLEQTGRMPASGTSMIHDGPRSTRARCTRWRARPKRSSSDCGRPSRPDPARRSP